MKKIPFDRLKKIRKTSVIEFSGGLAGAVLGMVVSPWFYLLTAAALYVPPVLRVFGVQKDVDEFELDSIKWGALASFVVTGCFLFAYLIFSVVKEDPDDFSGIMYFLIIVQAFSYFMFRYYRFWMSRRAGRLIIGIELLFWGLFTVLSAESVGGFLMQSLATIVPPAAIIVLSLFRPRISGVICAAFSIFTMFFFGVLDNMFVFILLSVPLMLASIALFISPNDSR